MALLGGGGGSEASEKKKGAENGRVSGEKITSRLPEGGKKVVDQIEEKNQQEYKRSNNYPPRS